LLISKSWNADERAVQRLKETAQPRRHGFYSFNPDTFECHNCVTWSVDTMNDTVGPVLTRVREGRIREMQAELEAML
jgi:hypothetical protein